ncbi:MAG: ribose 5-phosphate isomerase B [Culicoidibacterales bacterium]
MKIAIASDHGGVQMKAELVELLEQLGYECEDYGTYNCDSVDYPDYAEIVANKVAGNEADRGILICGTGIGMSIAANKVNGIRCALVSDVYSAQATRLHNDTNVLALGARVIGIELAKMITQTWLETDFEGDRHVARLAKITQIEQKNCKGEA